MANGVYLCLCCFISSKINEKLRSPINTIRVAEDCAPSLMSFEIFPLEVVPVITQKLSVTFLLVSGIPCNAGTAKALLIPGTISVSILKDSI